MPRPARLAQRWRVDPYSTINLIPDDEEEIDDDLKDDDLRDDANMELVKHPSYREDCLWPNHIIFRHPHKQLPDAVAAHVEHIASILPEMPELSSEIVVEALYDLETLGAGCAERDIRSHFQTHVFPTFFRHSNGHLLSSTSAYMARHLLPNLLELEVIQPYPDVLYGYSTTPTFTFAQRLT
ncbi:hypothetical protein B0T26DRAFT_756837 [Lasiosphaeria miniovina]|uniref:Uncharacterized protein n=1 Tax=Lasiosphaeria miniovina TaxID=1954250 RepID=A0AA39ZTA4_9PEZI|nr:uncharacterized protein B0T26DRAFT_756837 [Lasiosphaeria miniovina]KAK0703277.1 hypothetical protein B0T26DRAFT_756837 [Lasiosphaeria miniovina]